MKDELKYTCKHCGETNKIQSIAQWAITPHLGAKKYLRCKKCHKVSAMDRQGWNGPSWLDSFRNSK